MYTNILQFLENTAPRVPDKPAYISEDAQLTYSQLWQGSKAVGSYLGARLAPLSAVAIIMKRDVWCMHAILGTIYAGCFCAPLDPDMPADRILRVFQTLEPKCILVDESAEKILADLGEPPCMVVPYKQAVAADIDEDLLAKRREGASLFDPIEIFYTSGSTGIPKGVVYTHHTMILYTVETVPDHIINEDQHFGNQAPFFYANVVYDMYPMMYVGATCYFTPKECFLLPKRFLEFFQGNQISTVLMTPLNFIYIADSGILAPNCFPHLESIYMLGEVVSYDKMRLWREAAPNAKVYNFYAATECPYVAEFPLGDKVFEPGSLVPAGKPFKPVNILLLDENGEQVPPGEAGEMFITSPWLSAGYYNDPERTAAAFINNPLNNKWRQTYYRTGDIGRFNENGELIVLGRQDTQIKHRGYRMDLGEVEAALRGIEGWQNGCCLFDQAEDRVYCFWCGPLTEAEIKAALVGKIEKYMYPNNYVHLEDLPRTLNGKLDRTGLKKTYFGV